MILMSRETSATVLCLIQLYTHYNISVTAVVRMVQNPDSICVLYFLHNVTKNDTEGIEES